MTNWCGSYSKEERMMLLEQPLSVILIYLETIMSRRAAKRRLAEVVELFA